MVLQMFTGKKQPPPLDAQEAYNLWNMLQKRYGTIEQIRLFQNYIHDQDFSFLIKHTFYHMIQKQINELEHTMSYYQLSLPRRPPQSVRTQGNTEAYTDHFLAALFFTQIQEHIAMLLKALRTSVTSEHLRNITGAYLFEELTLYDNAIKYLKLKGWLAAPPLYPKSPPGTAERLDTGEAYHLWDHLTSRYDHMEISQIYQNYAHDKDFALLLSIGIKQTLEQQINLLEKEMDHFGLPLPERPPKSIKRNKDAELLEDALMYRQILTGLQFTFELHANAFKENITNDRLRKIFQDFLHKEVGIYNNYLKFGKLKGWLRPTPLYTPG